MANGRKELHIFDYNGVMVADSREIAEILKVKHKSILYAVRSIIKSGLFDNEKADSMFIPVKTKSGRVSYFCLTLEACKKIAHNKILKSKNDDTRMRYADLLHICFKSFSGKTDRTLTEKEENYKSEIVAENAVSDRFIAEKTDIALTENVNVPELLSVDYSDESLTVSDKELHEVIETEVIKSETVSVTAETDEVIINQIALHIKEYNGQRVVTFRDIDEVHQRPEGTASRNFRVNRNHFIEGEDYFTITPDEFRRTIGEMDKRQQNDIILLTESGYLMTVKSLKDDLAWAVQRELVRSYFRLKVVQHIVDSYMIEDPIERAKRWIQEQEEKKALAVKVEEQNQQIEKQNEQIAELSTKADYCDKVLQTSELVTVTDIAKDFGKSAVWLNKKLHERKIQFRQGGIWHLYQGYAEKGYAITRTTVTEDRNGREHSRTHTYWTQKGKKFIFDLLAEENIFPVTMQEQIIMMPLFEQEEIKNV